MPESGCEMAMGVHFQLTNEKIFMVRSACVVPLVWQPTVVVNPAPGHDSL